MKYNNAVNQEVVMLLEKLSELLKKKRWILITFIVLCIALTVVYLMIFFQTGIRFEDEFLIKHKSENQVLYEGESKWGDIKIFLIGEKNNAKTAEVIYELPGGIGRHYTVMYANSDNWYEGITEIRESTGKLLFSGSYSFKHLLTEEGSPYIQKGAFSSISIIGGVEQSPFKKPYEIRLNHIAVTAASHGDEIRGDFKFMLIGIFFLFAIALDFAEPLLFFNLRHILWANNAEPSDLYITAQRFGWNVIPILSIVMLLWALIP